MPKKKLITINKLDKDVAYMLGCLCGDGCISFEKKRGGYGKLILSTIDKEFAKKFIHFYLKKGLSYKKTSKKLNIHPNQGWSLVSGKRPRNSSITLPLKDIRRNKLEGD